LKGRAAVFVDSGAWIALAVVRDPLHERARDIWETLLSTRARLRSSVPVVLETYTFLDRRGSRELADLWRESLAAVGGLTLLGCDADVLRQAWSWMQRRDFHRLSIVDATSFELMKRHRIRTAFAFDAHFAQAGFRFAG
jgi:predicted nucleic acid-binding protein